MKGISDKPGWERAIFRYGIVSQVESFILGGLELAEAIARATEQTYATPKGSVQRVSRASLYRWYNSFKKEGISGLFDKNPKKESVSCLPGEFISFLKETKEKDPQSSIPEIIRCAERLSIIDSSLDRTTVYRAARKMNLPMFRRRREEQTAMRPFAYAHRMQMVLCDGKHFRAGASCAKRLVYFFLDDATRYVLYAIVGFSECSELFLRGFFEVIRHHGFISAFYLDKGPGFIALDAAKVAANLKIPFIFGRTRYPQGHGKIERFNDTAFQRALRSLKRPDVDPSPEALTLRLNHFLQREYNRTYHEGIESIPEDKFENDSRPLRYPESEEALKRHFILSETRKVRRDNVVSINKVLYEIPFGHAGRRIVIYRDIIEGVFFMIHEGRSIKLHAADLHANARGRRSIPSKKGKKEEISQESILTAADISFRKTFDPITDPFGGFEESEE